MAGLLFAVPALAQTPVPPLPNPPHSQSAPGTVTGQVRQSGTLKPVGGAAVLLEGTAVQTTTDKDGRFSIPEVPAGEHHLIVAGPNFMPLRVDVTIGEVPPAP